MTFKISKFWLLLATKLKYFLNCLLRWLWRRGLCNIYGMSNRVNRYFDCLNFKRMDFVLKWSQKIFQFFLEFLKWVRSLSSIFDPSDKKCFNNLGFFMLWTIKTIDFLNQRNYFNISDFVSKFWRFITIFSG